MFHATFDFCQRGAAVTCARLEKTAKPKGATMALVGTYAVTVDMMGSTADGTVSIEERNGVLTGTVEAAGMKAQVENAKASGSSFTGFIEGPTPLGTMRFKVSGTVTGDTIKGKLKAGLISASFQGKRI